MATTIYVNLQASIKYHFPPCALQVQVDTQVGSEAQGHHMHTYGKELQFMCAHHSSVCILGSLFPPTYSHHLPLEYGDLHDPQGPMAEIQGREPLQNQEIIQITASWSSDLLGGE